MSCCSKEKMERNDYNNTCKSHSAKSDREMYRICPSKLSKKELEDLYFTLLENNLELKKTVNAQQDKIRVLSTQVQRLSNTHDKLMSKEMKECSTSTKAFVNEQKDFITELKETNQRMAERIHQLNMRLCSAKQFAKTTPLHTSNSRRFRCATASPPKKHNCLSRDQDNEQVLKSSTSSQWEDRSPRKSTQSQQIVPLEERPPKSDQPCEENKCRSLMEELKIKIVTLQDELFNVHNEYSTRISRLETEVSEVRKENIRVVSERSASEHELQNTVKRTSDILAKYRLSEAKCSELTTELAIEKRKVAELETQLKAASMSDKVNKTIEDHLTTIHTLPVESPPKSKDLEDPSTKTKYSPSKDSSSASQQSKTSPAKTISEETNCETCGCKAQLMSDTVHSPASAEGFKYQESECSPPQDLSPLTKNIQCDLCGCAPPINTSTPLKDEKINVECCCPAWAKPAILKPSALSQDENAKCIKCCYRNEHAATESPPSKNGKFLSPRGATTRSPTKDKDSTKSSKTGDDSGYQDTDELVLHKQNRELMTKILELQHQVDYMKMRMYKTSEAKPDKPSESTGSPKKTRDYAGVATAAAPLLGESAKVEEPEEQIEYNKYMEGGNYEFTNLIPFPPMVSEERVREPGKILSIEILGDPKEVVPTRNVDDTRAKTIEGSDGALQITEDSSDKFSPLDLINDDYRGYNKTDAPKLKITEKKKGGSRPGSGNVSPKSATSDILPGFNPEKLKYLEAEGIITMPEFREGTSKLMKEDTVSLTESVPSNPELGFGIPRLASKVSQGKNKAEPDFGQAKKSPAAVTQAREDLVEVLQGKLKLPVTEALVVKRPAEPKQANETKKTEDCENCAACSFDKECELKHEIATNQRMSTLAPGMQKEQAKKHDQHNSLQIPGPIPTSDNNKRENMRNLFSNFMKDRSIKPNKEDFIINPKIHGRPSATSDGPANRTDVPLLAKKRPHTDSIKITKKMLIQNKTDKSTKQKKGHLTEEDLIENPQIYAQDTCVMTDEPTGLLDVPVVDKTEDSQDAVERKPSRLIFSTNNQDPPLLEVKMPSYYPHSERMLPTLLAPANWRGSVERKADVAQNTDQNIAEKSSQVPTNIELGRQRDVSVYRRRSGSLCYRGARAGPEPACDCAAQLDGYCSDKPRQKGIQAHDKEEVKSPIDQRHTLLTSERGTYTVNSKQTDTSTDNTDLDLSDLPMEKEKKSMFKSRPLSPGEDRTTTFTDTLSYYSPPISYLSEGEMPVTTSKLKPSEPDLDNRYLNAALPHKVETPPSQQMEAALQAISDELQRCRALLHAHRPAQRTQCASQTSSEEASPPIALRPGVATQGIGDTYAPTSMFTLHIGSIVLSDEAVINSRNKNLVLKWKFYDQPVTMARMHAGRVVVFDFSTEYDMKVTEDFLHYLKHEEMPIDICELDYEEEPFASCVLPLRDALLHTNTRADMSLALVAGPQMLRERANNGEVDTFDTGDEVGVIDLWCLMRADADMLPGINLVIAQPGAALMSAKRQSSVMQQVLDDYNELDLTMGNAHRPTAPLKSTGNNQTYGTVEYNRTSDTWSNARSGQRRPARESDTTKIKYDPSKYPQIRERKLTASVAPSTSLFASPKRFDVAQDWQQQSEIIKNEVHPKIRAPGDIRHAMERSNRLNDSRSTLNKSEDHSSQAQSSYSSLRSVLSRLQKSGSRFTQTHGGDQRSFIEKLRKAGRTRDGPMSYPDKNEGTAAEKFMKYENVNKATGINKAEQSKKVTIDTEIESIGARSKELAETENQKRNTPKLEITVFWLALNEKCEAMIDPHVQRVYVAYTFLGRRGAELETPDSLPKPKHYVDKCYFNFKKVFELSNSDLLKLGHMARCRANSPQIENENDCIIFSVISEPADDPLGIESCHDIGYAYLYLGDLLAYSSGSPGYTEVIPVRAARGPASVCGVLAVRLDGLDVVRRCLLLTPDDITGHST